MILSSSSIEGTSVVNKEGKDVGNIKDLMINTNRGHVSYAVLSFGGFLGMGDKYFAIPFEAFSVDTKNEKFVLNIDKDKLKNAPGFDKDNWPTNVNHNYLTKAYSYYGYEPNWN
ncbi:MAG: PRC-barrel domain-containing protein [Bacteroidota bacterium]